MVANGLQIPTWKSFGQRAFEAYSAQAGGVSLVSGNVLPEWHEVSETIKEAWEAAAAAVMTGEIQ